MSVVLWQEAGFVQLTIYLLNRLSFVTSLEVSGEIKVASFTLLSKHDRFLKSMFGDKDE